MQQRHAVGSPNGLTRDSSKTDTRQRSAQKCERARNIADRTTRLVARSQQDFDDVSYSVLVPPVIRLLHLLGNQIEYSHRNGRLLQ